VSGIGSAITLEIILQCIFWCILSIVILYAYKNGDLKFGEKETEENYQIIELEE